MPFLQAAPVLSNQYLDDRVLRSYLRRVLPRNVLGAIEPDLTDLGEYAASAWTLARTRERCEPKLTQWDVWGERVDRIELTPAWIATSRCRNRRAPTPLVVVRLAELRKALFASAWAARQAGIRPASSEAANVATRPNSSTEELS